jgi:hypothetical protein
MNNYIIVRVQVPYENQQSVLSEVSRIVRRFDLPTSLTDSYTYKITNLGERVDEQASIFESGLDRLIRKYSGFRYHIMIFKEGSHWPKSIRINKQGVKMLTSRMTDFIPL